MSDASKSTPPVAALPAEAAPAAVEPATAPSSDAATPVDSQPQPAAAAAGDEAAAAPPAEDVPPPPPPREKGERELRLESELAELTKIVDEKAERRRVLQESVLSLRQEEEALIAATLREECELENTKALLQTRRADRRAADVLHARFQRLQRFGVEATKWIDEELNPKIDRDIYLKQSLSESHIAEIVRSAMDRVTNRRLDVSNMQAMYIDNGRLLALPTVEAIEEPPAWDDDCFSDESAVSVLPKMTEELLELKKKEKELQETRTKTMLEQKKLEREHKQAVLQLKEDIRLATDKVDGARRAADELVRLNESMLTTSVLESRSLQQLTGKRLVLRGAVHVKPVTAKSSAAATSPLRLTAARSESVKPKSDDAAAPSGTAASPAAAA
jgi:hypothetical protein